MELERVRLTRNRHLWQRTQGHRTGSDDVLCAWAAKQTTSEPKRALELGAGQGAVSLILADVFPELHFTSVEAQVVSYELLERNVRENGFQSRFDLVCDDLRTTPIESAAYDLAFGTPPFMPVGSGTLPRDAQRAAARFEMRGGVESYCAVAARALRDGGTLAFVMDAARPERYEAAILDVGLHLDHVIQVVPRSNRPPTYLVYQASKGTDEDRGHTQSVMAIRDAHDRLTNEFSKVRVGLNLPAEREVWL